MKPIPRWMRDLGNTADGLFITDSNQRITLWNKGAEKLLGHTKTEVLGKPCYEVLAGLTPAGKTCCHSGCRVQRVVKRGGTKSHFNLLLRKKQGRQICANISIIGLVRRGRHLVVHLIRDVTREERDKTALSEIADALGKTMYGGGRRPEESSQDSHHSDAGRKLPRLTGREVEILALVATGLSTAGIAESLGVSPYTIRNHVRNVLAKLGLRSRTQAVSYAYKNGIV